MKEGHIYIDGVIAENAHLQLRKQIENLGQVDKLIVHIQSPGGSVYAGYNCYNVLKSAGKQIEAIIEGECQSIATFIMLAADRIIARNPSVIMIHNPYVFIEGDATAMENGANELRKIEDVMIQAYQSKTKLSEEQLREMMSKETSMSAYEAQKMGFVDDVVDHLKAVAVGKTKIKMQDKFEQFGNRMSDMFKEIFGTPVNMDVPLKDGTVVKVDAQEGEDLVGKQAMIGDQPAPAGEHELANGQMIEVGENGVIMEVKQPMSPEEKMKKYQEQMANENAQLKAEIEALKAQKAEGEKVIAEAQAKNQKTFEMLSSLQSEFIELRKMTVGNPNPAPVAPVAMVKPDVANKVDDTTEAFFKEFLPHLLKK